MKTPISGAGLRQIDRGTLGALCAELKDLNLAGLAGDPKLSPGERAAAAQAHGNANGVLFDEGKPTPGWARNVVVQYGKAQAEVGRSREDEEAFIRGALGALEAASGVSTGDYAQVAASQPHPSTLRSLPKCGVAKDALAATSFVGEIGNLGSASVGVALALALDAAMDRDHAR